MEESDDDLRKEVEKIYTPLSVAKEEIWRRWNDKELRKKVEDFLGEDIPEFFKDNPGAYFVRHIASPNKEMFRFFDLASNMGLKMNLLEYVSDKFLAKNKLKYYLGKCFFYGGLGKNGGEKISTLKVIDFNSSEGKNINEIKTIDGISFVDFHHNLIDKCSLEIKFKIEDISSWLGNNGEISKNFYVKYLALFVCNGILFENFLERGEEKELTKNVAFPAIKKIEELFGIKPIIVPLLPIEDAGSPYWSYYPEKLRDSK